MQDDCPMFFQAMRVLGEEIVPGSISDALFHAFVYVDFSGIFDRTPTGRTLELQKKAEKLFRPEGLWIDLGKGYEQYFAFERSASMSRNCKLSFVRADLCKPLRQRMMLNMYIGKCQLSKLYAYNGLMFTGGRRVEIPEMMDEKHIILIDNPKDIIKNVKTITVKDDGTKNSVRVYTRVEETADIKITEFDGEGLVSPDLAYILDSVKEENHPHHSFQIRMPYIKGVVHEVDFKTLFAELEVTQIQDIFGQLHSVWDIDMILTKSMFKGFGWMKENGISWGEYLRRCNQYEHGLYISGMDSLERRSVTELNYQFLVTANITQEEFRPADLPMGWKKAPPADRQWLTKATEDAYWSYVGDMDARQSYFTKIANDPELELNSRKKNQAKLVEKNPLFLGEPIFSKELQDNSTDSAGGFDQCIQVKGCAGANEEQQQNGRTEIVQLHKQLFITGCIDVNSSHCHTAQQRRDIHGRADAAEGQDQRKRNDQSVICRALLLNQQLHKQTPDTAKGKHTKVFENGKHNTAKSHHSTGRRGNGDGYGNAVCQQCHDIVIGHYLQQSIHKVALCAGLPNGHHGRGRCSCGSQRCQNDGKCQVQIQNPVCKDKYHNRGQHCFGKGNHNDLTRIIPQLGEFEEFACTESDKCKGDICQKTGSRNKGLRQ